VNLDPKDFRLFQHEYEKTFPAVVPREGAWDYTSDRLLLTPKSGNVDALSFQNGLPAGLPRLKVWAKGVYSRWAYTRQEAPWDLGTRPLVITDEISHAYFHWVADALPKVWWAREQTGTLTLILPSFASSHPFMTASLAPWPDLKVKVVPPRTRLSLPSALVLPAVAPTGNYRPTMIQGLASAWRDFVGEPTPWRRVYVSRAKAARRRIANEDAVWNVLAGAGFERVFLEDLEFSAQVKLMAETSVLISNHGAWLTNLMFMAPQTKVLELRMTGDDANNCFFSLASAVNVDYWYQQADPVAGQRDSHTADLVVSTELLIKNLEGLL
jgi:capsular polysaccharide biosynthesis protein